MKINGANLGKINAEFNMLSSFEWTEDENIKKLIKYLENNYISLFNKKDTNISKIPCDDNGKVIIIPGMSNHRCSVDLDVLSTISKYGVLATEWFGILESEREGCFCTFISKMKNKDYPYKGDLAEDNYSRLNIW